MAASAPKFPFPQETHCIAFLVVANLSLWASRFPPINAAPLGLAQHLYRERQVRKLGQSQAALIIGVDPKSYKAWEGGGRPPTSHHWPAIIAFLGCDPIIETPITISEIVSALRRRKGLTANELGKLLGVDLERPIATGA